MNNILLTSVATGCYLSVKLAKARCQQEKLNIHDLILSPPANDKFDQAFCTLILQCVHKYGACIVEDVYSSREIESFQIDEEVLISTYGLPGQRASITEMDAKHQISSFEPRFINGGGNRYHLDLLSVGEKRAFKSMRHSWLPFVKAHFRDQLGEYIEALYQSEMQMVSSLPGSEKQPWHVDNTMSGLTVIVPLIDITMENGPTEFVAYSHMWEKGLPPASVGIFRAVLRSPIGGIFLSLLCSCAPTGNFVQPVIKAGSILLLDARTVHRGLANLSDERRSILVFRYDEWTNHPPGALSRGDRPPALDL